MSLGPQDQVGFTLPFAEHYRSPSQARELPMGVLKLHRIRASTAVLAWPRNAGALCQMGGRQRGAVSVSRRPHHHEEPEGGLHRQHPHAHLDSPQFKQVRQPSIGIIAFVCTIGWSMGLGGHTGACAQP